MSELQDRQLIYDWNRISDAAEPVCKTVRIVDETLFDGVTAPAAHQPARSECLALMREMERLKVDAVNLGGLNARTRPTLETRVRDAREAGLSIELMWTVSAHADAVDLAAEAASALAARVGLCVVADVHDEHADEPLNALRGALARAAAHRTDVTLYLHDAACAHPGALRRAIVEALRAGVRRLCLWDSAGRASADGVDRLIGFVRQVADQCAAPVSIEWSGRNDRDMAVNNALDALGAGAETVHATALGLGSGAGNAALDVLLVNLLLLEWIERDLSSLKQYCDVAARALGVEIPVNYPIFGGDAFRTATGVHAAAIIKAQTKGDHWLADRVYSGVPAGLFGLAQVIDVGPMSGESNAVAWLRRHGVEPHGDLVKQIIRRAKSTTHILTSDEMQEEIAAFQRAQT